MSRTPRHWPHVLVVEDDPADFTAIFDAARQEGLRIGWLRWAPRSTDGSTDETAAGSVPPDLEAAAASGVLRAVAVAPGRTISVKPRRGDAVLRDVLREHFRGCALVLVRTAHPVDGAECLRARGEEFSIGDGVSAPVHSAAALVGRLRRPRPW